MGKVVAISDIHGNAPALEAVVEREGRDSEYLVLGDIHGLLAYPSETLDLVQSLDGHVIGGNHDKALFHKGVGHVQNEMLSEFELSHTITSLSHEQIDWMQALSYLKVLTRNSNRICLTHAYPWPEKASGFEQGNAGVIKGSVTEVASVVSNDYDWVFHGHTHEQYDLDCSKFGHDVHFVNAGSLGYDDTYSVVDLDTSEVSHKSVEGEYDRTALKEHIQEHLPDGAPHTDEWCAKMEIS